MGISVNKVGLKTLVRDHAAADEYRSANLDTLINFEWPNMGQELTFGKSQCALASAHQPYKKRPQGVMIDAGIMSGIRNSGEPLTSSA